MAGTKDYYDTLGVGRDASESDIKSAYKKLAKKWHPDVNADSAATEKFKEISEAYSVLSNKEKRNAYDQYGPDAFSQGFSGQGAGGGMPGFDFSDFFNQEGFNPFGGGMDDLFRNAFGAGFGGGGRNQSKPLSIRMDIEITLEEAAAGVNKTIEFTHNASCETCKGTGSADGKKTTCNTCNGRGMVTQTKRTPFGLFQTTGMCPSCKGKGETITDPCNTCRGKGSNSRKKEIRVSIPAGVDTGNHLRLSKEGNYSDGKYGDIFVVLHVKPHPIFRRDGADLFMEEELSYTDAVLGGEIDVPLLNKETATLKIPAHTKPGTVFRLKGNGMPVLNSSQHGDQYVRVQVGIPEKINKEEKILLEQLRELHTDGKKSTGKKTSKKKGFFGL